VILHKGHTGLAYEISPMYRDSQHVRASSVAVAKFLASGVRLKRSV